MVLENTVDIGAFTDKVKEAYIVETYDRSDWIKHFTNCKFEGFRAGTQTDSIVLRDENNQLQFLIFSRLDFSQFTFLGSVNDIKVNTSLEKNIYDELKNKFVGGFNERSKKDRFGN
jgi:hypothetical protein